MTQKTRIAPVPPQRASLLTKLMYRFAKRKFGEVPEPFTVAAHHPRLMLANGVHEMLLQSGSKKLPVSVRELAVFWTARTVGCSWCVDFGSMLIRLEGLDVERLKDIDKYATSPAYTDDERAAIAYADAMTTDPHTITDEQVDDLRAPVRRRRRDRADLSDRRREHAGPDVLGAGHHRAGLQLRRRLPGPVGRRFELRHQAGRHHPANVNVLRKISGDVAMASR